MRLWRSRRPSRPRRNENVYRPRVKYCEERFCAGNVLTTLIGPAAVLAPSIVALQGSYINASSYLDVSETAASAAPEDGPYRAPGA